MSKRHVAELAEMRANAYSRRREILDAVHSATHIGPILAKPPGVFVLGSDLPSEPPSSPGGSCTGKGVKRKAEPSQEPKCSELAPAVQSVSLASKLASASYKPSSAPRASPLKEGSKPSKAPVVSVSTCQTFEEAIEKYTPQGILKIVQWYENRSAL